MWVMNCSMTEQPWCGLGQCILINYCILCSGFFKLGTAPPMGPQRYCSRSVIFLGEGVFFRTDERDRGGEVSIKDGGRRSESRLQNDGRLQTTSRSLPRTLRKSFRYSSVTSTWVDFCHALTYSIWHTVSGGQCHLRWGRIHFFYSILQHIGWLTFIFHSPSSM